MAPAQQTNQEPGSNEYYQNALKALNKSQVSAIQDLKKIIIQKVWREVFPNGSFSGTFSEEEIEEVFRFFAGSSITITPNDVVGVTNMQGHLARLDEHRDYKTIYDMLSAVHDGGGWVKKDKFRELMKMMNMMEK